MPYVTEELWGYLRQAPADQKTWPLIISAWPEPLTRDLDAETEMEGMLELVRRIRHVRAEAQVPTDQRIAAVVIEGDGTGRFERNADWITRLARLDRAGLRILSQEPDTDLQTRLAVSVRVGDVRCLLPDIDRAALQLRWEEELQQLNGRISQSKTLLSGAFGQRAPDEVVQRERDKLERLLARREILWGRLAQP
jgi:valyl-tRNA synthetase